MAKRPGGGKIDMMSAADGPRASLNAANVENSIFNKHYNKELKLCEGKFFVSNLIFSRRDPHGPTGTQRERPCIFEPRPV